MFRLTRIMRSFRAAALPIASSRFSLSSMPEPPCFRKLLPAGWQIGGCAKKNSFFFPHTRA
jgi:hypothetical protein